MIRSQRLLKLIAVFFLQLFLWEICFPVTAYALTGGPSQPEVESFEPVNTTEMVDPFSGDFVYNIPLMDVEGMPINMAYHSGITMDQEASWVGLGWNINPGAITRQMRGLPDDFNGDLVNRELNIKESFSYGVTLGNGLEFFGKKDTTLKIEPLTGKARLALGINYNNYRGLGFELNLGVTPAFSIGKEGTLTAGLGLGAQSYEASSIDANAGLSSRVHRGNNDARLENIGLSARINGMTGLDEIGVTALAHVKKAGAVGLRYAGVSFGFPTFVPRVTNEYVNYAANLSLSFGYEFIGAEAQFSTSGYVSWQEMKWKQKSERAYGYAYSHNSKNEKQGFVLDFNRFNDGPYARPRRYMPLANFTYDVFAIAGEGTGGTFRTSRSDIGVVYDSKAENNTVGLGIGVGPAAGNTAKFNLDVNGSYGFSTSDRWKAESGNDFGVVTNLDFQTPPNNVRTYEPYYFRNTSENNIADQDYYNRISDADPVNIQLVSNKLKTRGALAGKLVKKNSTQVDVSTPVYRNSRDKRNMAISTLTAAEAQNLSLDKNIQHYAHNSFVIDANNKMVVAASFKRRISDTDKSRFSEFTVNNADGRRYVYGLPAMNNIQRDAAFNIINPNNINDVNIDRATGLVAYTNGANSVDNDRGEDNFFQRTTLPAYAHSYMLTAILSPDYVDITGDGISDDDLGTAVKLNYTRAYSNYKWRVPFSHEERKAYYDEGFKTDRYDDKGSYTYGEKEIWYIHSIESKNYVACFYTSKRNDACAVREEDGNIDTDSSFYKLDSIRLFTRLDLKENGSNAVPIKTVHFEYDYSLCAKVDNQSNQNSGKLTLKKVWFTYGRSRKGSMSPYQFTYSSFNPDYTIKGYDRWGYYKPTPSDADIADLDNPAKGLATHDNPYVLQDKSLTDQYMQAWSLSQVQLPSGGIIQLEYESDDYAFVQDKQAMQMFPVIGAGKSSTFGTSNLLYDSRDDDDNDNGGIYQYMFFDLAEPIPTGSSSTMLDQLKANYFPAKGTDVYFKFLVDLKNDADASDDFDYEFISGAAQISDYGFQSKVPGSPNYDVGYIKFTKLAVKDNDERVDDSQSKNTIHPVAKQAWNAVRMQQPQMVQALFGKYEPKPVTSRNDRGQISRAFKSLMGSLAQTKLMYKDFNKVLKEKGIAQRFVLNKSFVRLKAPTGKKLGGGSRVKRITINDNWANMVSGTESATYGQEFFYEKADTTNGVIRNISSGVAAYEPQIGREENPFYSVTSFSAKNVMAPDARYVMEVPLMECFYPAPNVGYSYVTTRNYKPTANIYRSATGYTVNEYYTAYDFPTLESFTNKLPYTFNRALNRVSKLFKLPVIDQEYVTQGYAVELNDMHGKPKAQWTFQENNPMPISGVEYRYKHHDHPVLHKRVLTDTVNVLKNTGAIAQAFMGKQIDMVVDLRHSESQQFSAQTGANLDAFFLAVLPSAVVTLLPSISMEKTEFGSAVTTKVIYRFGILDETIVHDQSASVSTKNVLFDGETGEVLLTQTTNEFNEPLYSFSYPAHFVSKGMGPAYQNIGMVFDGVWFNQGKLMGIVDYNNFIVPGDELCLIKKVTTVQGTVMDEQVFPEKIWAVTSPGDPNDVVFMSRSGNLVDITAPPEGFYFSVKIVRSGRRNMQSVSAGSLVTMKNPVNGTQVILDSLILQSTAIEFEDKWTASFRPIPKEIVSPMPEESGSGNECNLDCYRQLMDLLTDPNTTPNLLNLGVGDEIDLRQEPFKELYECILGSYSNPCVNFTSPIITRLSGSARIYEYKPFSGDEVLYASLDNTPHIEGNAHINKIARTSSVPLDPCDPFDAGPDIDILTFNVGGCTLTVWVDNSQICNCPGISGPHPDCVDESTITQCGNTYITQRLSGNDCPNQETIVRTRTKIECPANWCTTCDTADGGVPDTSGCLKIEKKIFVNPYTQGIKGNYRPKKSWLFHDLRSGSVTSTNTRRHGVYVNYTAFWVKPSGGGILWTPATSKGSWTNNTAVTRINRTGNEIENVNALNIYSAALFGYGQSTAKAVGNNMKYRQMAYDGMEDHSYTEDVYEDHFSFRPLAKSSVAHTGLKSVQVNSGSFGLVSRPVRYAEKLPTYSNAPGDNHYYKQPLDDQGVFSPDTGRYILSSWLKEVATTPPQSNYTQDSIAVILKKIQSITLVSPGNYDTTYTDVTTYIKASGPMIEGWQKVEGEFAMLDSVVCISVKLIAGSRNCYFDDLRIHPQQGNMKSFVYHPGTMRLMAELDENNYATFYEYDEEGRLVRIKRETERGIMTIQESRRGLRKTN